MTRERKLAIQMWEEVKKQLPEWGHEPVVELKTYKMDFCFFHGLDWKFDCWFCQYVREHSRIITWDKDQECVKCPLQSCDHMNPLTAWARIVNGDTSLETKLQACDDIIAALKGEHK